VGIARVSRSSFVAFELGAEGLHELPVDVDERGTTLHVERLGPQMADGSPQERRPSA